MSKFDLLMTLGHNSSAIIVRQENGESHIVCGYEEERLTRKKSDSSFPILAIRRCLEVAGVSEVQNIYATHWAVDGNISSMAGKHWKPMNLPKYESLISHKAGATHHDTHAQAAFWYAMSKPGLKPENTMLFVIDGFGNFGEHISIYQATGYGPKLIRRFFGYDGSLGLMYQYMTAFMGMKMHEDEYKILGYEVHIDEVDVDRVLLDKRINQEITRYLDGYFDNKRLVTDYDALIRLDALPALQKKMVDRWIGLCKDLGLPFNTTSMTPEQTFHNRVVLAYYVQSVLEGVVLTLIKVYNPINVIASGGVFYNVKLNRKILDHIQGKICVYPLAGDQGNALGLYAMDNNLIWPGHLNWGVRPEVTKEMGEPRHRPINMGFHRDWRIVADLCAHELRKTGVVNLVRGAMEFGPRALCNTSTIAIAQPSVVNRINRMNGRNTVMPMAPVMSRSEFEFRMLMTRRVHMSEEHMIVALPYKRGAEFDILGAAHNYKFEYTGRPQVLDGDPIMDQLLSEHRVLINTSFNYHGVPIVYSYEDAIHSHEAERQTESVTTLYLEETK